MMNSYQKLKAERDRWRKDAMDYYKRLIKADDALLAGDTKTAHEAVNIPLLDRYFDPSPMCTPLASMNGGK